ncbi:hypothetical protein CYR55_10375 [Chimaeribacter californicus]|uniref:Lipoprotein n=1 Tax=Chimaeribacter californicus TaxID=2060067 RepID=A0A2N5E783_9GAMM|nr:hypothetical protein [Chimaeribacter californicus]PLR37336.1 hypothetical protein CYR55_10375 [Chimaeribacter californicus]
MKIASLLSGIVCVVALAGCASKTAPVQNVDAAIAGQYTESQVKNAILSAGLARKWVMAPVAPGVITGHVERQGHSADIRINYTAARYTINYVNSQNLLAANGVIHRNYNRWVNNLNRDIQLKISAQNIQ